jgi:N-methylhydantoinase B
VFAPIFYDHGLVGFVASRAHWLDIGSMNPAEAMDSTEIFQEGLRLGPTKVVQAGRLRRDIVDIIARNTRLPESTIGDLYAQITVARMGARRFAAILDRYGPRAVESATEQIFTQSERLDREAVSRIPDGTYFAEGCLDNDGVSDEPVWVRVAVTVTGDQLNIDLTGSSDATNGPVNCGEPQTISACRLAFKYLINPGQPVSGGSFRPLQVRVRPGSVLAASAPRAFQFYYSHLGLLIDLVIAALAPAIPDKVAAAHYGDAMVFEFWGDDPRTAQGVLWVEVNVGGWGAWQGSDGQDALIWNCIAMQKDMPIEVFESKYPIRISKYAIRPDSGGPGRWRGGCGIIREYQLDADVTCNFWFERSQTPPWGLFGGKAGLPPLVVINPGRPNERSLLKASHLRLKRGDIVRCLTSGGGGFGEPRERDPEQIRTDLADGFISSASAVRDYHDPHSRR